MKMINIIFLMLFLVNGNLYAQNKNLVKSKKPKRGIATVSNFVNCNIKKFNTGSNPVTESVRVSLNYDCHEIDSCQGDIEKYKGEIVGSELIPNYKVKLDQTISNSGAMLKIKVMRLENTVASSETQYLNENNEVLTQKIPQVTFNSADNKKFVVSCELPDEG